MARTVTTSGGAMTAMWRSVDDDGTAIDQDNEGLKLVEPEPNEYVTPPKGTRAKLRLSGLSETFQMPKFDEPEVMEDKVRAEFQIIGISGKNVEWMKGKRFTQMYTDRVSEKSNLGKLFRTLTGQPIPPNLAGYPYDGFIGTEFVALIGENPNGTYAKINHEAIETGKTVLSPAVVAYLEGNGGAPQPALMGAAEGASDPFAEEEL
jgi:hypothetical protein